MADPASIINEIKEQERTGFFKSSRKIANEPKEIIPIRKAVHDMPGHITNSVKITGDFRVEHDTDSILFAGVGINAVAGELLKAYLRETTKIAVSTVADYTLPENVGKKTLVFIISYSGIDEEPISCYRMALRKGCKIVGVVSGGKLQESLIRNNTEHLRLPSNIPEPASLVYLVFPILKVLENSGIIKSQKAVIDDTVATLQKPMFEEMGDSLAENLRDKIPVIYSSRKLRAIVGAWKNRFNLIAGISSFTGTIPDVAHNDLAGYEIKLADMHVIILRDEEEDKEIVKSISVLKGIIKNQGRFGTTEIMVKGSNMLTKMMSAVYIADWAALDLKDYYGKKSSVNLIEIYKDKIKGAFF